MTIAHAQCDRTRRYFGECKICRLGPCVFEDLLHARPGGVIRVRPTPIEWTVPNRLFGTRINAEGNAI